MKWMFLMGFLLLFCLLSLFGEEEKPAVQEEKKIAVPVILNLIPGIRYPVNAVNTGPIPAIWISVRLY